MASAAVEAVTHWIELIDQGRYADSYQEASDELFKPALTEAQWEQAARAARGPLGDLVSRHVSSATHRTTLPGAPDGDYYVVVYQTQFGRKAAATETGIAHLESGTWKVSGYWLA
ncbi:DUF4019 domain-containing protein [Pelomyxa schiedti]|nr:DUF4019 domain-containing protein [Pelomyxa schiedti]